MHAARFAMLGVFVIGLGFVRPALAQEYAQPNPGDPIPLPPTAMVTFTAASSEMAYFLRIIGSDGIVAECYTPCNLSLPRRSHAYRGCGAAPLCAGCEPIGKTDAGKGQSPQPLALGCRRPVAWHQPGRVHLRRLLLSLERGRHAARRRDLGGGLGVRRARLTSAMTLMALGGRNRIQVIDNPMKLKAALPSRSRFQLAGLGAAISPLGTGLSASFRF